VPGFRNSVGGSWLFTPLHYTIQARKKLSRIQLYQAGHVTASSRLSQLRNCVSPHRLSVKDWQLCATDVDNGLCGLLNTHNWMTCMLHGQFSRNSFQKHCWGHSRKHRGGSVGSMVANHHDGGGNSLVITTQCSLSPTRWLFYLAFIGLLATSRKNYGLDLHENFTTKMSGEYR